MERLIREFMLLLDLIRDRPETVEHRRRSLHAFSRLTSHIAGHSVANPSVPDSRFVRGRRRSDGEPAPFLRSTRRQNFGDVDRNADARRLLLQAVDACGHGVIFLDLDGGVEHRSARAGHLIARYLPNTPPRRDRLPPLLERWVRQHEGVLAAARGMARPIAPLVIGRQRQLLVHLFAGMTHRLLLLRERVDAAEPRRLESCGLTRREAEVLTWVAQGKTNGEIGTILGLSRRTAEKHVEHILHKLGVENRTTAAGVLTGP
jgi:DNA-binding CsgD family transcriptional regulator